MSVSEQDRVRLNALIDGALDAVARAELLDRVANEPALARELSALGRLKAVLADSVEVPDIPMPALRRPRRRLAVAALAASLALVLAASLAWLQVGPSRNPGGVPLEWVVAAHRAWTPAPESEASDRLLRPARATPEAYVPDLSAARLYVTYVGERRRADGNRALVVGYSGTRGCRVTLVVSAAARALGENPANLDVDGVMGRGWRVGRLGYIVLAEGMDGPRFGLIADSIYRASLERLPLDGPTRTELALSRTRSKACMA